LDLFQIIRVSILRKGKLAFNNLEGIMKELKRRRQYMKPSVKRRKKAAEAARRRRKRARMEAGLLTPAPPRPGQTRE